MNNRRFEQDILNRNASITLSLYEVLGIRAKDLAAQGKTLQASFDESKKETVELLSSDEEAK